MSARTKERGQALVEFSIAIILLLVIFMGVFDLGRGIYVYNGVSQAAREIARRTSVYPGITLGQSAESQAVIAIQRAQTPGMAAPTFQCVDIAGSPTGSVPCPSGSFVRVTVSASYDPVTLLGLTGPITLTSTSSIRIP
jgi:Flp pilus assembly protein TadG